MQHPGPKIILLVGRPGSGKTKYSLSAFSRYKRIAVDERQDDDIYREVFNAVLVGHNIVFDGCNGSPDSRAKLIEKVRYAQHLISIAHRRSPTSYRIYCHFLSTSLRTSMATLMSRYGKPQNAFITDQVRYNVNFKYPDRSEGFEKVHTVQLQENRVRKADRKALFFDLGSVAQVLTTERFYSQINVLIDVHEAFRHYSLMGYLLIGLTNRDTASRAFISHWDFQNNLIEIIRRIKAPVDDILYCPHSEDKDCNCRIPKTGLISAASCTHNIDLAQSIMVGQKTSHRAMSEAAGIKKYYHRANFFAAFKSLCPTR